jgi:putative redox protein
MIDPMEHLLAGLGGCTAMDVISILRKKRLEVREYRLDIVGARRVDRPKVYEHISIRHIVTGHDIPEEAVSHALQLSEEKYCSAYAMLRKAASISTTFEVRSRESVGAGT